MNNICITGISGTVASAMGIEKPKFASEPIEQVLNLVKDCFNGEKAERVLIYNPDAIALWLYQKYTDYFNPVLRQTQLCLPMLSVMPCVTPVCFASMYTGALPDVHGIKSYTKPVLSTDTLFDALIRAGKKPAIVSSEGDSISKIFLEREMDYFIYDNEEEVNEKAIDLIKNSDYDLITVYNGNYDSTMHKFAPESEKSLDVLKENCRVFSELVNTAKESWKDKNSLFLFSPDHGCHEIDGECGSHGLDMPEDMDIVHFFGVQKAKK